MEKKFSINNFNKPTPKLWKRIGNTAIYGLPLLASAVQAGPFDMGTKCIIVWYLTLGCTLVKIVSKFFTEPVSNN